MASPTVPTGSPALPWSDGCSIDSSALTTLAFLAAANISILKPWSVDANDTFTPSGPTTVHANPTGREGMFDFISLISDPFIRILCSEPPEEVIVNESSSILHVHALHGETTRLKALKAPCSPTYIRASYSPPPPSSSSSSNAFSSYLVSERFSSLSVVSL